MVRVAVIGGGISGLVAIKSCLEYELNDIVCYERASDIGGTWFYESGSQERDSDPTAHDGLQSDATAVRSSCMKCTVMNTNKVISSFSDFPVPDDYPLYLPYYEVKRYLDSYADHFNLRPYIKLNHEVTHLKQLADTRWRLTVVDSNKNQLTETFDYVMVCAGFRNVLTMPQYAGLDKFKGHVSHAAHYRTSEAFRAKRVLVVGLGPSSADICADLNNVSNRIIMSHRRGDCIRHFTC